MDDTAPDIKQKQLEIWLSKPPMERLRLTLVHNDELFAFWNELKKNKKDGSAGNAAPRGGMK